MSASQPIVTVVTPVYNQSVAYLERLWESVLAQTEPRWTWLVSDDHSSSEVWRWIEERPADSRIDRTRQPKNLGLFANLNATLRRVETPFALLLCADDRLAPDALERLLAVAERCPEADLVLPACGAMDSAGRVFESFQQLHHATLRAESRLLTRTDAIEMLLRCGSFNGNLTGMFLRRSLFDRTRGFREDWTHAADWDWMHRAARAGRLLLTNDLVAYVRQHDGQLSATNFRSGALIRENAAVIRALLAEPELRGRDAPRRWARHAMQIQAWYAVGAARRGNWRLARIALDEVRRTSGLVGTLGAMLAWMPARVQMRLSGKTKLAPWQSMDG